MNHNAYRWATRGSYQEAYGRFSEIMKKVFDYKKPARLIWQDPSKMTTGVGYLRGQPAFEGTLEDALEKYEELPLSSRAFAHLHLGSDVLDADGIEAVSGGRPSSTID
jgi:hypothetical protein